MPAPPIVEGELGERALTPEMLIRWVQFGAVSGVMRTQHNGFAAPAKVRPQIYDDDQIGNWKRYAKLRTQLYPYIAAAADTQTTYELGDGDGTASYIGAIDTETFTAGSVVDGEGAYLSNSGGKLYTADDTVDVVYTVTTAGATNPMVTFCIGTVRDW